MDMGHRHQAITNQLNRLRNHNVRVAAINRTWGARARSQYIPFGVTFKLTLLQSDALALG